MPNRPRLPDRERFVQFSAELHRQRITIMREIQRDCADPVRGTDLYTAIIHCLSLHHLILRPAPQGADLNLGPRGNG